MAIQNLKDVYLDQLQDIHSANAQSMEIVTELGRAAKNEELSKALIAGNNGIADGLDKIKSLCKDHGVDPEGEFCKGMQGLVREARAHGLEQEFGDDDAHDAMIITQYQRMCHYAIAGYGCLMAFANRLGLDGDAAILKECLDASYDGDRHMSAIAEKKVNAAAA
ncbi:DUF892 family protein [Mesobaculum littorinae]|uniref:DUF892 family protein n=1 Tax=Mesobaculum littorinae TaxID=2486419 RepID=A0A438ACW7_9RHOB|nr:DUF892 family protein [Mesobaculum littorinae]RVV96531.1 DUF892 family protein [Mesobaculum littorinae]